MVTVGSFYSIGCDTALLTSPLSLFPFQNFGEELHRNIEEGSALKALSVIKKCINGAIVNSWDGTKEIPLTKAARTGQHAILQALIDHPFIEVDMLGVSNIT